MPHRFHSRSGHVASGRCRPDAAGLFVPAPKKPRRSCRCGRSRTATHTPSPSAHTRPSRCATARSSSPTTTRCSASAIRRRKLPLCLMRAGLPTDKLQLGLDPLLVKTTGSRAAVRHRRRWPISVLAPATCRPPSPRRASHPQRHRHLHLACAWRSRGRAASTPTARPAFPNATIHISQPEWDFLKHRPAETAGNLGISNYDALIAAMTPKVGPFVPGARSSPARWRPSRSAATRRAIRAI